MHESSSLVGPGSAGPGALPRVVEESAGFSRRTASARWGVLLPSTLAVTRIL